MGIGWSLEEPLTLRVFLLSNLDRPVSRPPALLPGGQEQGRLRLRLSVMRALQGGGWTGVPSRNRASKTYVHRGKEIYLQKLADMNTKAGESQTGREETRKGPKLQWESAGRIFPLAPGMSVFVLFRPSPA